MRRIRCRTRSERISPPEVPLTSADKQSDPDWSRWHGVRAGTDFLDAIWLDGYQDRSVWGFNGVLSSFFAQVWLNGSTNDEPDLWITPSDRPMPWPHMIVPQFVDFTGEDPLPIVRAMGVAAPTPALADGASIAARLEQCRRSPSIGYSWGESVALEWLLGNGSRGPSSGIDIACDGDRPAADVVDAEATHATGIVYLTRSDYMCGVEGALMASLRPLCDGGSSR